MSDGNVRKVVDGLEGERFGIVLQVPIWVSDALKLVYIQRFWVYLLSLQCKTHHILSSPPSDSPSGAGSAGIQQFL
jgi:hypothetical protein